VKRPRGRPRKTKPERGAAAAAAASGAAEAEATTETSRGGGRPEEEYPEDEYVDPHHMPDPVHFLAQMLIQGEAEARRRKAERYKNMLGL
jgi:hypothetical protein